MFEWCGIDCKVTNFAVALIPIERQKMPKYSNVNSLNNVEIPYKKFSTTINIMRLILYLIIYGIHSIRNRLNADKLLCR